MPLPNGLHFWIHVQTEHVVYANSYHGTFEGAGPTTAKGANDLANKIFVALGGLYVPLLHSDCHVTHCSLRYITGGTDLEGISYANSQAGSLNAGGSAPDEVCLCIQRRTGQGGRSKRGRIFISGLSNGSIQHSHLSGSPIQLAALNLAAWIAADFETTITNTEEEVPAVIHQRHWDRKNNALLPITNARPLGMVMSRRDRRGPGQSLPITTTPA